MRRGPRQKMNGDAQDWCSKWWRRAIGLMDRPGVGKAVKRQLARQRRREPMPSEGEW